MSTAMTDDGDANCRVRDGVAAALSTDGPAGCACDGREGSGAGQGGGTRRRAGRDGQGWTDDRLVIKDGWVHACMQAGRRGCLWRVQAGG